MIIRSNKMQLFLNAKKTFKTKKNKKLEDQSEKENLSALQGGAKLKLHGCSNM